MLEVANSPWRGAITPIVEEDAAAHEKEGRTDLTLVAEAMRRAGQRVISSTSAASRLTVPAYRRTGQQTTNLGVRSSNLFGRAINQVADFVSETSAVSGSRLTAVWFGMFVMVSGW